MPDNPYIVKFDLKQHTPLIHFQHEQDTATLRASELKPKLDKYILDKLGGWNDHNIPISWRVGKNKAQNDQQSLDYLVSIESDPTSLDQDITGSIEKRYIDRRGRSQFEKFPTFFGLMGDENAGSKKFVLYTKNQVKLTFTNSELRSKVQEHISDFFMHHNFGTRQGKGFGSFYPENSSNIKTRQLKYWFDVDTRQLPPPRQTYTDTRTIRFRQYYRLFEVLSIFYSSLRSGINQKWGPNPIYFKSMMFMYAKYRMRAQWDKKTIKDDLFPTFLRKQKVDHPHSELLRYSSPTKYLLRDLLGLASRSEWFAEYDDTLKTVSVDGTIDRYKSPIFFKPLEDETYPGLFRVFFESNQDSLSDIYDKEFEISNNSGLKTRLKTPPSSSFKIDDYLRYAFATDLERHIETLNPGYSADKELLKNIYNQIRTNAHITLRTTYP